MRSAQNTEIHLCGLKVELLSVKHSDLYDGGELSNSFTGGGGGGGGGGVGAGNKFFRECKKDFFWYQFALFSLLSANPNKCFTRRAKCELEDIVICSQLLIFV